MDEKAQTIETKANENCWQMGIEEFDTNGCLINGD